MTDLATAAAPHTTTVHTATQYTATPHTTTAHTAAAPHSAPQTDPHPAVAPHSDPQAAPQTAAPRSAGLTDRLASTIFSHARLAMITVTTAGTVVEINEAAAELLGRRHFEMVQEPIEHHVALRPGRTISDCLFAAARSEGAQTYGPCVVRRRGSEDVWCELIVSSGCQASGRDVLLVQLLPMDD